MVASSSTARPRLVRAARRHGVDLDIEFAPVLSPVRASWWPLLELFSACARRPISRRGEVVRAERISGHMAPYGLLPAAKAEHALGGFSDHY